ncbi:hypothetical protein BC629DRAFT_1735521 [Irpex lacteus]|nr:hypothetical protein BC629DRAFT_1735521 [Irpex lacteus]
MLPDSASIHLEDSSLDTQHITLQTLPVEILVDIFTVVLNRDHALVIILAQLSQDLRHVVLSTPSLWSTLSLSKGRLPEEKAALWSSRNQGLLKNLYIRDDSPDVRIALHVLRGVPLNNLRSLVAVNIGRNELSKLLPHFTPAVVSNLESLTLKYAPYDDYNWLNESQDLQLRRLQTYCICIDWAHLATHCTHLRELSYEEGLVVATVPDIIEVLRRNRYLEAFTLRCHGWLELPNQASPPFHYPSPTPGTSIELKHLTSLRFYGGVLRAEYFIPFLAMPNLRSLELEGLCSQWNDTIRNLIDTNAVGRLVSLAIIYTHINIPDEVLDRSDLLIELLRNTSQLKYLELFRVTHVGPVLRALACDPAAQCPQLATLDVSQCDVDNELLMDVVRARDDTMPARSLGSSKSPAGSSTSTVTQLRKLVINSCFQVTQDTLSWLREHVPHVTCHYSRTRRQRTEKQRKQDAGYW